MHENEGKSTRGNFEGFRSPQSAFNTPDLLAVTIQIYEIDRFIWPFNL